MKPLRVSRPISVAFAFVCVIGGLIGGGFLAYWCRRQSVDVEPDFDYEAGFYMLGGAALGLVAGLIAAWKVIKRL